MIKTWIIKPQNTPTVIKNCSHCGCQSEFACNGNFRINANQKRLDVWLIYKCRKCDCTWNMDIFSRVRPDELERGLYDGLLRNSRELAFRYAFDVGILNKNRVEACYKDVQYSLDGDKITIGELLRDPVTLHIKLELSLQLRLDRVLSERLEISRSLVKALLQEGAITLTGAGGKAEGSFARLKGDIFLQFHPEVVRKIMGEDNEKQKSGECTLSVQQIYLV